MKKENKILSRLKTAGLINNPEGTFEIIKPFGYVRGNFKLTKKIKEQLDDMGFKFFDSKEPIYEIPTGIKITDVKEDHMSENYTAKLVGTDLTIDIAPLYIEGESEELNIEEARNNGDYYLEVKRV